MDAEAPTREQYVKGGAFWLIVLLAAGYVAPRFVGVLLMLFSVLVFVLALIGLAWPELMKLPNRLASVWVFTLSVGLFIGGGMLMAPPNGPGTAMDNPRPQPARRAPVRRAPPVEREFSVRAGVQACYSFVRQSLPTGANPDFPAFRDGAAAVHRGGNVVFLESYADITSALGLARISYTCTADGSRVTDFEVQ